MTRDDIAAVCHEANRRIQQALGEDVSPPWGYAPQWQRDSAIAGVHAALDGTAKTAAQQHGAWLAHKEAEGWVYGPVKDEVLKTHPCMVPYDQLPDGQKKKDRAFRAIVIALAPLALEPKGTLA